MRSEPVIRKTQPALAQCLAVSLAGVSIDPYNRTAAGKALICLDDLIGCALESVDKPPSQQAMALAVPMQAGHCPVESIEGITIRVSHAGATYPVCNFTGPYLHVLQVNMSIQYNVAAALAMGDVTEANFDHLNNPLVHRLLAATQLEIDDKMTRAYPALQGGAVEVHLPGSALSLNPKYRKHYLC